jgi:hypothetical protein
MKLSGLHLLLTYQCTFECDHCFAWGSPWQDGTMTLEQIRKILRQAQYLGGVSSIYFEGGEPFLYYPVLSKAVQEAAGLGFRVGIVSNGYWANSLEDALEALRPFAGLIGDLSVSSDLYHYSEKLSRQAQNVRSAAEALGIPVGVLSIDRPEAEGAAQTSGQLQVGESGVMFRGRAAELLSAGRPRRAWESFTTCPHENLRDPGRVHVDPFGYVHLCQGIAIGNLFQTPLREICAGFDPDAHPIVGPLLAGGPAGLAERYGLPREAGYADACHLCYEMRKALRGRFPEILAPDGMYGEFE